VPRAPGIIIGSFFSSIRNAHPGKTERWSLLRVIFFSKNDGRIQEEALEECREREPKMRELAHLLMDNFLGLVEE
jgi:hypothetical protein